MAAVTTAPTLTVENGHWIVRAPGRNPVDFGPAYTTLTGAVATAAGKSINSISPAGLISYADGSSTQLTLTAGDSAMAVLVKGGLLPSNASAADFKTAITGPSGKDSTVAGPSNYTRALALQVIPSTMTEAQYLASLNGVTPKSGLLASGTTQTKGNAVYQDALGSWVDIKLVSHELVLGGAAMVDSDGDVIASGNAVKVTGLGYVLGSVYYVDARDSSGRNTFPVPVPFPAGLNPSPTRSYYSLGKPFMRGTDMYLNFVFQAALAPTAAAANFSGTDFTFLPYATTPTAAQIRRLVDTQGNYGASLNGLHSEGDAGIPDNGFPTPPPRKLVNGVLKNVMLFDIGYNGFHANTLAAWGMQQSGDWLNVFEVTDGNQAAPGFIFGANAAGTSMWGARLYGACTLLAFQQITISGDTVSTSDFRSTVNVTGANKVLMCMRLNISADGKTVTVKVWPYDTARSLAQQALSEPAASSSNSGTYTASTAFPAGYVMPVFGNGTFRRVYSAKSNDPSLPAQFDGDL